MDDKIGGPTKFLLQSITQGVQASVDLCGRRERLSVGLFRSDLETEDGGHAIAQELDWDTAFLPHCVADDLAVAVEQIQKVLREHAMGRRGPSKADEHHGDFALNGLVRWLARR